MASRATVDVEFSVRVTRPGPAAISVAAAHADTEELIVSWHGESEPVEFAHGTRAEVFELPAGEHRVTYHAERALTEPEPEPVTLADAAVFTRPSRYCPSDRVAGLVAPRLLKLGSPEKQVDAIVRHVHERLSYVVGSSRATDDAIDTLLAGEGVCRDFAHVCVTLCRFLDIPARYVAVYAPGLSPMDFHAVFEAAVDGHWYVFDATRRAPRRTMLRIATGRDAADTAFLATLGCELGFLGSTVFATTDTATPPDDGHELVVLG
ncbi:transglutaminase-like domain-containing protein [Amycolatopsis australiensis]|uniref:Transglutaminase-like enzyme, putative cysteine protease n=1 Tax=Amycolatopsis australiensis TaxID=546364 RepID=A0A1K1SZQ1_9PSEU|nr:transglutaminase family protein [Amycolatopsis australiensis]SFW89567.1 Transglutaminase-like enzyme, putative cysteine protease [Amycolatopsis australiensis]